MHRLAIIALGTLALVGARRRRGGRHAPTGPGAPSRSTCGRAACTSLVRIGPLAAIHGSEIETVRIRIVPHSRISAVCHTQRPELLRGGEKKGLVVVPAGRSADVAHMLLHEYAHHIDMARSNFLPPTPGRARGGRPVE